MSYNINRIQDDVFLEKIIGQLSQVVERKLEILQEQNTSPYINGIEELAKYLNIGNTLAQELKNSKEIPCSQRGRSVWFKKTDIDKFMQKNRL